MFVIQCRLVKSVGVLDTNFGIDNFRKNAVHKKPVFHWKFHSSVKFGSRCFLKFKLDVKHRIEDQFQI